MKLILYNIYKRVSWPNKQKTSFKLILCYIDDIILLTNPKFDYYIEVIYPKELRLNTLHMLQNGLISFILI